jgi:FecR protein
VNLISLKCVILACSVLVAASPAWAQTRQRCSAVTLPSPPRTVLRCTGVTLEAEQKTQHGLIDRNRDGEPEGAQVNGGAVLIEVEPTRRGGFQILSPHATAAVRGTVYAVDVQPAQTSVFVAQGRVAVRKRQARGQVVLGPGQGVDVVPGQPLEVKTWSPQRASNLLARFGR